MASGLALLRSQVEIRIRHGIEGKETRRHAVVSHQRQAAEDGERVGAPGQGDRNVERSKYESVRGAA